MNEMRIRPWHIMVFIALAAGAGTVAFKKETSITPPVTPITVTPVLTNATSTPTCDASLWDHVYHPNRLVVHDTCVSVTGVIMDASSGRNKDGTRHEADGDTHGWIKLDPPYESMINVGNTNYEGGNMVFEIICHFPITQADAKQSCGTFKDSQIIPPVGSHVKITGSYVQDTNHGQWQEIHPVSVIEVVN